MNVLKPGIFLIRLEAKCGKPRNSPSSSHGVYILQRQNWNKGLLPSLLLELTPVCSEKEWICDEEREKDDLPPTPLSPLSRDLLRGKRQLAEELESETPTEDEAVSAPAQPAPRMKISDRLAKVKPQPVRVLKHGNCPAWLRIEASCLVRFR